MYLFLNRKRKNVFSTRKRCLHEQFRLNRDDELATRFRRRNPVRGRATLGTVRCERPEPSTAITFEAWTGRHSGPVLRERQQCFTTVQGA